MDAVKLQMAEFVDLSEAWDLHLEVTGGGGLSGRL
jgi:hypothetical protein